MLNTAIALAAETEVHSEPAVSPWLVGGLTLVILLLLLLGVVGFGGGREHS